MPARPGNRIDPSGRRVLQILDGPAQQVDVVQKSADTVVAAVAEQTAHFPGRRTVVDCEVGPTSVRRSAADCAMTLLGSEQRLVLHVVDAVQLTQSGTPLDAPLGGMILTPPLVPPCFVAGLAAGLKSVWLVRVHVVLGGGLHLGTVLAPLLSRNRHYDDTRNRG